MPYQAVESPWVPQESLPASPRRSELHLQTVEKRLDSLEPHLSWFYVRLLLLTGVSWAIQAAELVLLIFTRVRVANDVGMGTPVLEIFGASIFVGSMAGGPIFGFVADVFGRRVAISLAMVFSLGGLAVSARANTEYVLIIGRVITGIGLGGQLSSTVVLVQELAPRAMRGRVVSLLDAFTGIGGMFGIALAFAVAPRLEWRTTYLVLCALVLYTVVLHFAVPESPRWLASVGRTDEALAIVEKIEVSHGQLPRSEIDKEVLEFASVPDSPSSSKSKWPWLQSLVPTFVLWSSWVVVTLCSYALGIYVPTLISLNGYNMFASWRTILVMSIAQVLGSVVAALVLDSYGPQRSLSGFATLAAIISIVLSYVGWSRALVIGGSFLETALLAACWSCVLTYTPEYFMTARRGRGMGYAVGVSRFAAVGGCYLYPHMFNVWVLSVPSLCWIFGGMLVVVAVGIVPYFGHKSLDQGFGTNSYAWGSRTDLEPGLNSGGSEERSTGVDTNTRSNRMS